jgi:uncharacterized protein (DUF305 family)
MLKKLAMLAVLLTTLSMLTACGNDEDPVGSETRTAVNGDKFNDADVTFASDMIQHHSQALAMVDLTMGRKLDPEVQQLAENIRMAQGPEIEQMTDWLNDWDQPIPESVRDHANAHGDANMDMSDMPGMMSPEEMDELESAQGAEFQEMWLEMMVEHHEGAIEMARVEQSEGTHAAAIELAEQIESTQQDEISAMETLLERS